jgi:hypothetical protein
LWARKWDNRRENLGQSRREFSRQGVIFLVLPFLVEILDLTGGGDEEIFQPTSSVAYAIQLVKW